MTEASTGLGGLVVDVTDDDGAPRINMDDAGRVLSVDHPDGSVDIYITPQAPRAGKAAAADHGANLATEIAADVLATIGQDLIERIATDIESRNRYISDTVECLVRLGVKREEAETGGVVSKVRHPLLLESVLRFQANSSAELLPADGPCKVRVSDTSPEFGESEMADRLAQDVNTYLTEVAVEYYPDSERMLFQIGFSGLGVKKVYRCPLRDRIVAEMIEADKLIVDPSAVAIETASRVTHVFSAAPSLVKRMQYVGAWRDIDLGLGDSSPAQGTSEVDAARDDMSGIDRVASNRVDDEKEHPLYECYCLLDLPGYEHKGDDGNPTGIALPYRVTLHQSLGHILEIRRAWRHDDDRLIPAPHIPFVAYQYVPWSGFYPLGLVHILGGLNDSLTAAWRILMDLGTFANFPGFLHHESVGKQETLDLTVQPGQSKGVKAPPGMPLAQAIMPLPYTTQHAPALFQFQESVSQYGQRLAGTAETAVGEGRQDAPVGTTIALIEQAIKILASVHKRLHRAQKRELKMIVDLIRDDPEAFLKSLGRRPGKAMTDTQTLIAALDNEDIRPSADPNTASHMQRVMRSAALLQLSQQAGPLYDTRAVHERALRTLNIEDPQALFAKMPAAGAGNPMMEATAKAKIMDAETRRRAQEFKEREAIADSADKKADRDVEIAKIKAGIAEKLIANPQVAAVLDQLMREAAMSGAIPQGGPIQ